jgi:hypothetical protein
MANNDMVTLNIYNRPPQIEDDTGTNIIETDQGLNLNTEKPRETFNDNVRNPPPPPQIDNANSVPRATNKMTQNMQSSVGDTSETIPSKIPIIPVAPQYNQYPRQQYMVPVAQPVAVATPGIAPRMNPGMAPYTLPYAQPAVAPRPQIPQAKKTPVNNAPRTIIIKEKDRRSNGEDCCAACLAGAASFLAICCLMGLCCPRGPYGHRRGW